MTRPRTEPTTQIRTPAGTRRPRVRRGNEADADDMRQAVLAAAVQVFLEGGTKALTMRAVALKVGVSPMTPYRYFPDKTALLGGVWQHVLRDLHQHISEAVRLQPDGRAKLRSYCLAFLQYWEDHPDYFALCYGFNEVGDTRGEPMRAGGTASLVEMLQVQQASTQQFADAIGAGMAHAKLAEDMRYAMMLGYLHGVLVNRRYAWSDKALLRAAYVDEVVRVVERVLLHGPHGPSIG